ncbi:MAG: sodium/solute symporter [Thermoguttaceae bacterium]|nr:sodium/solute symporter [Thermoguttaceae bacterium]
MTFALNALLLAQTAGATLNKWDWTTLAIYFALLLGLAWWVVSQKNDSSKDYFLAGKKAGWIVIGASLFASNIGSEHLVGLAGTGASDGMAMAHYELHAWCLLVLGWVMIPFYERSGIFTTPEFLERRYSPAARWTLSLISLVAYIFTKISVTLFAGGIVFKALFPGEIIPGVSNFWVGAVGMVVITGLYTILGGLRAVLYTELLQTLVLLVGASSVLFIGLHQVGGWSELKKVAQDADHLAGYKIVLSEEEANSNNPEVLKFTNEDGEEVDAIVSRPMIDPKYLPANEKEDESAEETGAENEVAPSADAASESAVAEAAPVVEDSSENEVAENAEGKSEAEAEIEEMQEKYATELEQAKEIASRAGNYLTIDELSEEEVEQLREQMDEETFNKTFASVSEKPKPIDEVAPAEIRAKVDHFNLWKPISDPKYPWLGLLLGAPVVGLWYWCTDQYIVQRTLAATDQKAARRGTIFGAYLKLTPVFIFIVPGMLAYGLAAQGKLSAEVLFDGNQAFPYLVKEVLPTGLRGIVIGGLLAALMSSLASVFNSCSTLFTMDIYKKLRPEASEKQTVWVGRVATVFMVVLGLLWIPTIALMKGTLYNYLQSVQSYMAPPIFVVFFIGVFSKRVNGRGCMTALIVGFVLGMARLACEIFQGKYGFQPGTFAHWFSTTSYTFMCIYLTLVCVVLMYAVSLASAKPKPEQLDGLTYWTATKEQKEVTRASWNWVDVFASVGLIVIIITIYAYFVG